MFKSTKLLVLAGLATVATGVAAPAFAQTETLGGTTDLMYEGGSKDITSEYGWAMSIPTTIHFTNENSTVKGNVTLKPASGFILERDFASLTVKTTVTSQNSFKLKGKDVNGADRDAAYSYVLGGKTVSNNEAIADFTLAGAIAGGGTQVQEGTYTLQQKIGVQGTYTDRLTYSFNADFVTK